jgi:hypothetical protein
MTEVLVSILIMAIGVFSVIGLFPMATLRSIRATQLTQAAILKKNAETVLGYSREVGQFAVNPQAQPWLSPNPMYDPRLNGLGNSPRMVFDPVGWHLVGQQNFADGFQAANDADLTLGPILRLNGGSEFVTNIATVDPDELNVAYRLSSGDTWINIADSNQVTYTPGSLNATVSGASAAGLTTGPTAPLHRVLLFDLSGRVCQSRPIVSVGVGDSVNWDEAGAGRDYNGDRVFSGPLPAGFTPVSARIQTQDRRYTWIMTLPVPGRYVHVAVFFNRAYDPADELVYDCVPVGGEDDNGNGVLDPGEDDNGNGILDPVQLEFGPTDPGHPDFAKFNPFETAAVAPGLPQFVRRNSFALDAVNLEWYRVETINGTKVTVTTLDGRRTDELRFAIFMRGIVDVYPMQPSNSKN